MSSSNDENNKDDPKFVPDKRFIKLFDLSEFENPIKEIATGGFGTVYCARCKTKGKDVALKKIHKNDEFLFVKEV